MNLLKIISQKVTMLKEFVEIGSEGTWPGLVRYLYYKMLTKIDIGSADRGNNKEHGIGIVGAGTYVASIHLPCLKSLSVPFFGITSLHGKTASALKRIYKFSQTHQNIDTLLSDNFCDYVLIASPHYLHPEHIIKALSYGKYTYCEKPAAIDKKGINLLLSKSTCDSNAHKVMIGFNRRFSPAIQELNRVEWFVNKKTPMEILYRVNFGQRTDNSMSDKDIGGGRLHGAVCHYVDLISYLVRSRIVSVSAVAVGIDGFQDDNTFMANIYLDDGSIAGLSFTSEGQRGMGYKEDLVLTCDGHYARITDFKKLYIDKKVIKYRRHTYGNLNCMRAFINSMKNNESTPISLVEGIEATIVTLAIEESIYNKGQRIYIA